MRKAGMARPARDEHIANLEERGQAGPGDASRFGLAQTHAMFTSGHHGAGLA